MAERPDTENEDDLALAGGLVTAPRYHATAAPRYHTTATVPARGSHEYTDYRLAVQIAAAETSGMSTIYPMDSMLSDKADTHTDDGPASAGFRLNLQAMPTANFPRFPSLHQQPPRPWWMATEMERAAACLADNWCYPLTVASTPRLEDIESLDENPAISFAPGDHQNKKTPPRSATAVPSHAAAVRQHGSTTTDSDGSELTNPIYNPVPARGRLYTVPAIDETSSPRNRCPAADSNTATAHPSYSTTATAHPLYSTTATAHPKDTTIVPATAHTLYSTTATAHPRETTTAPATAQQINNTMATATAPAVYTTTAPETRSITIRTLDNKNPDVRSRRESISHTDYECNSAVYPPDFRNESINKRFDSPSRYRDNDCDGPNPLYARSDKHQMTNNQVFPDSPHDHKLAQQQRHYDSNKHDEADQHRGEHHYTAAPPSYHSQYVKGPSHSPRGPHRAPPEFNMTARYEDDHKYIPPHNRREQQEVKTSTMNQSHNPDRTSSKQPVDSDSYHVPNRNNNRSQDARENSNYPPSRNNWSTTRVSNNRSRQGNYPQARRLDPASPDGGRHNSRWDSFNSSGNRSSYRPKPKFNLKTFGRDENYTIDEFISVMDDYVLGFPGQTEETCAVVKSYLTGEASSVVIDADAKTWEEIKAVLLDHYRPAGEDRTHMAALLAMQRKRGEAPSSLAVRIRTSTRKAYPNLKLNDLDAHMIQIFLRAMNDKDLVKTVLTNDVREYKKVVEISTRLDLAEGNKAADTISHRKPSLLHFQTEKQRDEMDEATIARVSKIVLSSLDEAKADKEKHTDRGRPKDRQRQYSADKSQNRRDFSNPRRDYSNQRRDSQGQRRDYGNNRNDRSWDRNRDSGRPRSQSDQRGSNRYGNSTRSSDRRNNDTNVQGSARPRSNSRNRPCYKCHGMGHFLLECPSQNWYKKDGSIDHEKDELELKKNNTAPNDQRTPNRP